MALEQKLRLKLAQRLVMTPSLQQAIKLLQLSRLELEEALSEEILENPVLDVEDQPEEAAQTAADGGEGSQEPTVVDDSAEDTAAPAAVEDDALPSEEETYQDIDVEAFFADYLADGRTEGPSLTSYSSDNEVPLENVVSASPGLADHLLWQLRMSDCPQNLIKICEFVIGNLDEDGFLRATDEEIVLAAGAAADEVAQAVSIIRSFDPPGSASRSLQECLVAQIDQLVVEAGDSYHWNVVCTNPQGAYFLGHIWRGHWDASTRECFKEDKNG